MDITILETLHKIGHPEEGVPGVRPHILRMVAESEIAVHSTRGGMRPVNLSDVTSTNFDKWCISSADAHRVSATLLEACQTAPVGTASASNAPARARRDLLTPVIEAAQKECGDQFDAPAVWASLVRMAGAGKSPLLGVSDDGIKWKDSNDEPQFLNIKNLRDRLSRSKKKAQ